MERALGARSRSYMLSVGFKKLNSVLCLGAHADDIEIGCGGTILKLVQEQPGLKVWWVVFSARAARRREARGSARAFLSGAGQQTVLVKGFRDGFFPFQGEAIKDFFEAFKERIQPDLVFTHYREDRHQDHRLISDLAWNTFRDHAVLEYEIPKYDGDLGNPNLYVPLGKELCWRKAEQLCSFFQTQSNKHWFSSDTFLALMRMRGVECASKTQYAEAFYARKLVL
jgi:LmbE family N-acetylglucosaminyl deacetylase